MCDYEPGKETHWSHDSDLFLSFFPVIKGPTSVEDPFSRKFLSPLPFLLLLRSMRRALIFLRTQFLSLKELFAMENLF